MTSSSDASMISFEDVLLTLQPSTKDTQSSLSQMTSQCGRLLFLFDGASVAITTTPLNPASQVQWSTSIQPRDRVIGVGACMDSPSTAWVVCASERLAEVFYILDGSDGKRAVSAGEVSIKTEHAHQYPVFITVAAGATGPGTGGCRAIIAVGHNCYLLRCSRHDVHIVAHCYVPSPICGRAALGKDIILATSNGPFVWYRKGGSFVTVPIPLPKSAGRLRGVYHHEGKKFIATDAVVHLRDPGKQQALAPSSSFQQSDVHESGSGSASAGGYSPLQSLLSDVRSIKLNDSAESPAVARSSADGMACLWEHSGTSRNGSWNRVFAWPKGHLLVPGVELDGWPCTVCQGHIFVVRPGQFALAQLAELVQPGLSSSIFESSPRKIEKAPLSSKDLDRLSSAGIEFGGISSTVNESQDESRSTGNDNNVSSATSFESARLQLPAGAAVKGVVANAGALMILVAKTSSGPVTSEFGERLILVKKLRMENSQEVASATQAVVFEDSDDEEQQKPSVDPSFQAPEAAVSEDTVRASMPATSQVIADSRAQLNKTNELLLVSMQRLLDQMQGIERRMTLLEDSTSARLKGLEDKVASFLLRRH